MNNNVDTKPNTETTKITGTKTLNDFSTAGGTLSPKWIFNALTRVIFINNSEANKATITPANIAPVPKLESVNTPDTETGSFAPFATTWTAFGIIAINETAEIIAAAKGFS